MLTSLAQAISVEDSSVPHAPVDISTSAMTTEERATAFRNELGIIDREAWVLAVMYSPQYYANAIDAQEASDEDNFRHYVTVGFKENISPSPLIDISHLLEWQKAFYESEETSNSEDKLDDAGISIPVVESWISEGMKRNVAPNDWFDEDYYHARYSDIRDQVTWGFRHYATSGYPANRMPCNLLEHFANELLTECPTLTPDFPQLALRIPYGCHANFFSGATQAALRKLFMADLYRAQLPELNHLSDNALFLHYIFIRPTTKVRPSVLFHETTYRKNLQLWIDERIQSKDSNDISEYESKGIRLNSISNNAWSIGYSDAWLHWFFVGTALQINPSPLFDQDYYLSSHPELMNQVEDSPFEHYAFTGCYEHWRRPSVFFNAAQYKQQCENPEYYIPLLDYIISGQFEGKKPFIGFQSEMFKSEHPLLESPVELAALQIRIQTDRLESGVLADITAKALAIEPQLCKPYGPKNILHAPMVHVDVDAMRAAERIRINLPKNHYESVILIPRCRMSGAARVAGQFARAVGELTQNENVLVISTESDEFEYPDWFPERMDIFDISQYIDDLSTNHRLRILLDVVRGLEPSRLININSNLGWQLTNTYCRQLSEWLDLYFYLFCWDKDIRGNKVGYPVDWFLPSFDYCKTVFTDSDALSNELRDRFCPSPYLAKKIVTLHTPAENNVVSYSKALQYRGNAFNGKRRIFWCGRFDRQKRIDLLLAVAERMPDVDFWVWGKPVLDTNPIDFSERSTNIQHMGSYSHIDDVPISSCDCFLYTAAWDGLPTVLIDVGSRAIPVVASAVGGVGELIRDDTGWPIHDVDNPEAYVSALKSVIGDYSSALEKADALREHTLALCSKDDYLNKIDDVLNTP